MSPHLVSKNHSQKFTIANIVAGRATTWTEQIVWMSLFRIQQTMLNVALNSASNQGLKKEKELLAGKLQGGALSGRNSRGTQNRCPKTNSTGKASKTSFGAERKPSITQGKQSTQLLSESMACNAMSER